MARRLRPTQVVTLQHVAAGATTLAALMVASKSPDSSTRGRVRKLRDLGMLTRDWPIALTEAGAAEVARREQ